jgi:L-rhamnose mutarotase
MTRRTAMLMRLKPECVDTYLEYHRHVWPELEAVYHAAGMTDICCYVSGTMLVVTVEVDPKIHDEARAALAENPVERTWQSEMLKLRDLEFTPIVLDEVYRLPKVTEVS